ncbi:MAG: hypothetical protein AAB677_03185, partial [Patescibacteria group bacterium]
MKMKKGRYLIGIDEAGRGPLAGPVSVAAVAIMSRLNLDGFGFGSLRDSKKLSAEKRERWFRWLQRAKRQKKLNVTVSLVGEKIIDRRGIAPAVRIGIARVLRRLKILPD